MKLAYMIIWGILLAAYTGAETLTYTGDNELCVTNTAGNETCLNKGESYDYTASYDYLLTLNPLEHDLSVKKVFQEGLTPEKILFFGVCIVLVGFIVSMIYMYMR